MLINMNINAVLESKPRFGAIIKNYSELILCDWLIDSQRSCRGHALIIVTKNDKLNKTSFCNPGKLNSCFIYENTCVKDM